jgi:hypothetical protein
MNAIYTLNRLTVASFKLDIRRELREIKSIAQSPENLRE